MPIPSVLTFYFAMEVFCNEKFILATQELYIKCAQMNVGITLRRENSRKLVAVCPQQSEESEPTEIEIANRVFSEILRPIAYAIQNAVTNFNSGDEAVQFKCIGVKSSKICRDFCQIAESTWEIDNDASINIDPLNEDLLILCFAVKETSATRIEKFTDEIMRNYST